MSIEFDDAAPVVRAPVPAGQVAVAPSAFQTGSAVMGGVVVTNDTLCTILNKEPYSIAVDDIGYVLVEVPNNTNIAGGVIAITAVLALSAFFIGFAMVGSAF